MGIFLSFQWGLRYEIMNKPASFETLTLMNKDELTPYDVLTLMNCWEYCSQCKGFGVIYIKAGIPNIVATCFKCSGGGIVWT